MKLRDRYSGVKRGGEVEGRRQGGASKKKKRRESDEEPALPRYLWHTPVNVLRERRATISHAGNAGQNAPSYAAGVATSKKHILWALQPHHWPGLPKPEHARAKRGAAAQVLDVWQGLRSLLAT